MAKLDWSKARKNTGETFKPRHTQQQIDQSKGKHRDIDWSQHSYDEDNTYLYSKKKQKKK